ncbi:MAG: hypothetical protein IVW56_11830 [Candidatus Binataceae bacterium]|nr:hypothetical protein [Candidatus Binataceae bacterium]
MRYKPRPTPRPAPPPLPAQNNLETPPSEVAPTPPPVIAPEPATPPEPAAVAPMQPMLPAIFRGCWQGEVEWVDSIERLPGAAKIGPWTPKTYRLCYERYGNGPFQLTLTEAGIQHNSKIINSQGVMHALSTDGRTYATMQAFLHFDEYHVRDYFGGATFPVDETTRLQCDIQPDGMHVSGNVYGMRDGSPWFRAYWHTVFVHVPD